MKTLVFFALRQEAAPFQEIAATWSHCRSVVTGVGPVNAQNAARRALAQNLPQRVLTCGFAGALNPALPHHAILFEAPLEFACRQRLLELGAVSGRFHMTDRVLVTAAEKSQLRSSSGADAVEMESGAIHRACAEHDVPCATVRIVSDIATEDMPLDFNAIMTSNSRINYFKLSAVLLRSPMKVKALMVFQRRLQDSARRLAKLLAALLG
jgi:adenosylhomocysteine nucleosidase